MERRMNTSLKMALLLGAVALSSGPGIAQSAVEGPMQGIERGNERGSERLVRDFDVNRDGRVTHDEMNRTIGARFAAATHHAPKMTMDIFQVARAGSFRATNEAMFRRLDWNGDGKLSLAEFAAPQRVRFVSLDREGTGFVSCVAPNGQFGRAGLSKFCSDNDLNMDGRVTRGELDSAIAKRFSQSTGGSQNMNIVQFNLSEQQRFALSNARLFRRLDEDGDGLLTVQEFGGNELKLFATLDKNHDGVLGPRELHGGASRSTRSARTASN
jgi:Ca2+-binding EF-hand superfamily protein